MPPFDSGQFVVRSVHFDAGPCNSLQFPSHPFSSGLFMLCAGRSTDFGRLERWNVGMGLLCVTVGGCTWRWRYLALA